jgi:hypothetical protein
MTSATTAPPTSSGSCGSARSYPSTHYHDPPSPLCLPNSPENFLPSRDGSKKVVKA